MRHKTKLHNSNQIIKTSIVVSPVTTHVTEKIPILKGNDPISLYKKLGKFKIEKPSHY